MRVSIGHGIWLKALASITIFAIVFTRVDIFTVGEVLRHAELSWLLLGASLAIPMGLTAAQRWRSVSASLGEALPLSRAMVYTWIGQFINLGLPTLLGLDSMRAWKLRQQGVAIGRAVRIVIVDRLCSLVTLLVIIALGLTHLLNLGDGPFVYATIVASMLGALGITALSTMQILERFVPLRGRLSYLYSLSRDFNSALLGNKSLAAGTAAWGVANHLCRTAMVFCLAMALGIAVTPLDVFALVTPALLIAMVPITLAGWGLREAVFMQAFSLAAVPPDSALALSLLYGFVVLVIGLLGGAVWFAERRLQKQVIEHAPDFTP
jgi:uncharacterized membrane protein YbhN (UPF0104 family)